MFRRFMFVLLALGLMLPQVASARWIEDTVSMEVEATGPVQFSHYNHLEALGKKCTLCHNGVYNIVRSKNPSFTMDEMRKGKACGSCHNGTKAFAVDADCSSCHPTKDIVFKVEDGDATFPHSVHTGMYGCTDCHTGLYQPERGKNPTVNMEQMGQGESCGACHDGNTAFTVEDNCGNCHEGM